jgi:hypothetical protein
MAQREEVILPNSTVFDLAWFRRIGMALLAEEPADAESIIFHRAALEELERRGQGALRYDGPDGSRTYIVLKNGTRYTSQTPPVDIPEDQLIILKPADGHASVVWDCLNEVCARIKASNPEVVKKLWLDQAVDFIRSIRESGPIVAEVVVLEVLGQVMRRHAPVTRSEDVASACSLDALNAIAVEYKKLHLPGNSAKKYVAVLAFLSVHPDAAAFYAIHEREAEGLLRSRIGGAPPQALPANDIRYYLTHPESEYYKSFIAAKGAARMLRRTGKEAVIEALSQVSINIFYEKLYDASLNYLAAREIYGHILGLGIMAPSIWKWIRLTEAEVRNLWVETEEARVTIGASFVNVVPPGKRALSPMEPDHFFRRLATILEEEGYEKARSTVHDLLARLILPEIVHDLALVLIDVIGHRSSERTLRRARDVLLQLEANAETNQVMGDPNLLPLAYSLMAAVLRTLGRDDEARIFDEKARSNLGGLPVANAETP